MSSSQIVRDTMSQEGIRGFYRGYLTTVVREIPFSLIQFPLWEWLKQRVAELRGREIHPW